MNEVIIVSGLPRSGTSMLMNILSKGGVNVLIDNERKADEFNKFGYFEYNLTRNINESNDWISEAKNMALKVVSPLLYYLPLDYKYKIIFMNRNIETIISSQIKMLERTGYSNLTTLNHTAESYETHLTEIKDWLTRNKNFETLYIDYENIVNCPLNQCILVSSFLNRNLNINSMTKVVKRTKD